MKKIRTRYAPSPTGYLHMGGARTALFCYLFAKHNKGDFIIRTEDTDQKRDVKGGEKSQIDNLEWLGVIADESVRKPNKKYAPYRQSERLDIYKKYLDLLLEKKMAYIAYDTPEEILIQKEEQKKNGIFSFRYDKNWLKISEAEKKKRHDSKKYVIRFELPKNKNYSWNDLVRSKITVNSDEIGDFVIWKQDGFPTYNFACVIDDHLMDITHVFRGEEHISNTPKQMAIYESLGWESPKFGHFTIITNMEGKKLSKRDKELDQFLEDYKNNGYISEAIFNFLALLGWSPKHTNEIMSHDQLIKQFDIKGMSKSPSKYDVKKLQWFSNQYYKKLSLEELRKRLIPYIKNDVENKSNEWIDLLLTTYQPQMYADYKIVELTKVFFKTPNLSAEQKQLLLEADSQIVLKTFLSLLDKTKFTLDNIKSAINETKEITKMKGKKLFIPIRLAATHIEHGPELFKTIFLSGQENIKKRIKEIIK